MYIYIIGMWNVQQIYLFSKTHMAPIIKHQKYPAFDYLTNIACALYIVVLICSNYVNA